MDSEGTKPVGSYQDGAAEVAYRQGGCMAPGCPLRPSIALP